MCKAVRAGRNLEDFKQSLVRRWRFGIMLGGGGDVKRLGKIKKRGGSRKKRTPNWSLVLPNSQDCLKDDEKYELFH